MVIYLYGSDSYRRLSKLEELISEYRRKNPQADIIEADFEDEPERIAEICDFLKQPALFSAKKAAIVRNGTAEESKRWIETLKLFGDSADVFVLLSDSVKKPAKRFSFLLKKPVLSQEFGELEGVRLEKFVRALLSMRKVEFEEASLKVFLKYLASSDSRSWRAKNEIEKLALLGKRISCDDVSRLIKWREEPAFYNAVRAFLKEKSEEKRIVELEELLLRREDTDYIFNMLGVQANTDEAKKLAVYDIHRKSGKLENEEALLSFALNR